ncbi:hypothetical protein F2P56_013558 [Juglans regia]|uniref:Retrotransposon Copia-like N-terminal domain-containing protein n=1 Tax=Juglans regia TaxID=51240 RepID=A0A834CZU4_JUGRE|nr:hypothetical protein F2P56_013558 [Juglans regia]
MASPAPHSSPPTLSSFSHIVTTKLTNDNFLLWKVQISAYLRGQGLFGHVDGSLSSPPKYLTDSSTSQPKPNPDFTSWQRTDQLVLSVLFSSLSDSILGHVLSSTTAHSLWSSVVSMFDSHSHAKEFQIRFQLTNLSKGDQTISDYFGKVRSLVDSLATIGNTLPDKEIVTYLLNGLGPSYEAFITSVTARADPLSSHELFQLLLINESRVSHQNKSLVSSEHSVNLSVSEQRDHRGRGRQGRGRGRSNSWNNSRGRSNSS